MPRYLPRIVGLPECAVLLSVAKRLASVTPRLKRSARLALAGTGMLLLSGCGQAGTPPTSTVTTYTSVATVDSGAFCIPDLNTAHITLMPLQLGGAASVVPSSIGAQQVREGAVPAPPNSQLIAQGHVTPQAAGGGAAPDLGQVALYLYETNCAPVDVQAFYVASLLQNQWSGSFVPAGGTSESSTATASTRTSTTAIGKAGATLFDLAALTTGRFVNIHPKNNAIVFITVLAAIEAPGTPQERHPTYVQLIVQPSTSTAATPILPPTVATTPNVGASGGPPPGETAP